MQSESLDLNANDSSRWENKLRSGLGVSRLQSTIPLAKAMGAVVTCHLHSGVTHILCNLSKGEKSLEWSRKLTSSIFDDVETGESLLFYMIQCSFHLPVHLVSPEWIKKRGVNNI
jgi:hypothetical protein